MASKGQGGELMKLMLEVKLGVERIREQAAERQGVPPESVDMTNVEAFYVLRGDYIDGSLDRAVEAYGSMDVYLRSGLGLTEEEIESLRDQLLEPAVD